MKRTITILAAFSLAFAVACSGDETKDAASQTKKDVAAATQGMKEKATAAAETTAKAPSAAAAAIPSDAASACRALAASGAWDKALDVCRKAHEMMPDDLALEHAYQQAQAAAGQ